MGSLIKLLGGVGLAEDVHERWVGVGQGLTPLTGLSNTDESAARKPHWWLGAPLALLISNGTCG